MFIETLKLKNFRCFGAEATTVNLATDLTVFVGSNGSGKTAVMQALQRLFGITNEERRIRRQDFHVPARDEEGIRERRLELEAVLAFPELDNAEEAPSTIPEFFQQMAADVAGELKCRLRLEATWTDDGSTDGLIDSKYQAIRTFEDFEEDDCTDIKTTDRLRIQMIYVPASRDGASQVTAFLRGRLWRAVNWSEGVRSAFSSTGEALSTAFSSEPAVTHIATALQNRWQEVHSAGTDTSPSLRPLDLHFHDFIRKVDILFQPTEDGRARPVHELSDGQRSLFHLAMTAATLDVETAICNAETPECFQADGIPFPALTLIAVEEPENNLAPFYLSSIVTQLFSLTNNRSAQAVVASHSPSILSRVDPEKIRHFRLKQEDRTSQIRCITLPAGVEEASKYVREAVLTYPELYFARFVVLGEGASEAIVLPRLAQAQGLDIDRSFVAVVPLGGRHVNHLWRLLNDLDIPYATLLDLDLGRDGGGWGRIKSTCEELIGLGILPDNIFLPEIPATGPIRQLEDFDSLMPSNDEGLNLWRERLQQFKVFFCAPLDLDYSMLSSFYAAYTTLETGMRGPNNASAPHSAVLGENGNYELYGDDQTTALRWYRYLFLGRGKPSTHIRILSSLSNEELFMATPPELNSLIDELARHLGTTTSRD